LETILNISKLIKMNKGICLLGARELIKIQPAAHQRNGRDFQIFPVKENFGRISSNFQQ